MLVRVTKMYDIVIVGAGPAGANLARLVGYKYRVLVLDKKSNQSMSSEGSKPLNTKCCGGLLAPDAQKSMATLGLSVPKDILADPQIFAVRAIDINKNLERLYQRFYFNFDRAKFDGWMVSLIPQSVDVKFNAHFKSFAKTAQGYEVRYTCNSQEYTVSTKIIVGADGANSIVRKAISSVASHPVKYIAIQEWFYCDTPMPYFTAVFDQRISDFYSWVIPKNNHILVGAALKPKDNTREKFEQLKTSLVSFGFCIDNKVHTEGAFINRPTKTSQLFLGEEGITLIGEAAGAISPSSAEGFSYALRSSMFLSESLQNNLEGYFPSYKSKMKALKANILIKNLKSPAMYNPALRYLAMKSGFMSIKKR